MTHYELSEQAALDIENIYIYTFLNFGAVQANAYHQSLKLRFDELLTFPELGQKYLYTKPVYRRLVYRHHAIYDRVLADKIFIARLLHTQQDPARYIF